MNGNALKILHRLNSLNLDFGCTSATETSPLPLLTQPAQPTRCLSHRRKPLCSTAIALTLSLLFGSIAAPVWASQAASTQPVQTAQAQTAEWNGVLNTARLSNSQQQITALVVQLDLWDKPETTYANASYQVYARINGQWQEVYTNLGSRTITNDAGHNVLPPEVILLSDMQNQMNPAVELSELDLKFVVSLRYDLRTGEQNQQVVFEDIQSFSSIAQTMNAELVNQ